MTMFKALVSSFVAVVICIAAVNPERVEAHTKGIVLPPPPPSLIFFENWDSYEAGSDALGQGGWEGFFGASDVGALVDDTFSVSPANSIRIEGTSDLVHRFAVPSGIWILSTRQYIPGGFSGNSYLNLFKVYQEPWFFCQWSAQVHFDAATGTLINDGASGGELPYLTDEWVEIKVLIDLDNDTQTFLYNGEELYSGTWTSEVAGPPGGLRIGAIDLFANGASPIYYEDISLSGTVSYAVELTAATTAVNAAAGSMVTYRLTVTNTGNFDDVYDIFPGPGAWAATTSLSEVSLTVGESATFEVVVEIPVGAVEGDSDFTIPNVSSRTRNETGDSIALTTTVSESIFTDGFDEP